MLFANRKIMPSESALRLLVAQNGKPIESEAEHQGALYFRIKDLVIKSQEEEHEDVRALIEEYLTTGEFEDSLSDYAYAILGSEEFNRLWRDTRIAWQEIAPEDFSEETLENSIANLTIGTSEAKTLYEDTNTLRKYLEQLSMYEF